LEWLEQETAAQDSVCCRMNYCRSPAAGGINGIIPVARRIIVRVSALDPPDRFVASIRRCRQAAFDSRCAAAFSPFLQILARADLAWMALGRKKAVAVETRPVSKEAREEVKMKLSRFVRGAAGLPRPLAARLSAA